MRGDGRGLRKEKGKAASGVPTCVGMEGATVSIAGGPAGGVPTCVGMEGRCAGGSGELHPVSPHAWGWKVVRNLYFGAPERCPHMRGDGRERAARKNAPQNGVPTCVGMEGHLVGECLVLHPGVPTCVGMEGHDGSPWGAGLAGVPTCVGMEGADA